MRFGVLLLAPQFTGQSHAAVLDGTVAATARRTGIGHLVLMVQSSGEPARDRETIARLGAEVLPRLRDQPRTAAASAKGTDSATSS